MPPALVRTILQWVPDTCAAATRFCCTFSRVARIVMLEAVAQRQLPLLRPDAPVEDRVEGFCLLGGACRRLRALDAEVHTVFGIPFAPRALDQGECAAAAGRLDFGRRQDPVVPVVEGDGGSHIRLILPGLLEASFPVEGEDRGSLIARITSAGHGLLPVVRAARLARFDRVRLEKVPSLLSPLRMNR